MTSLFWSHAPGLLVALLLFVLLVPIALYLIYGWRTRRDQIINYLSDGRSLEVTDEERQAERDRWLELMPAARESAHQSVPRGRVVR